MEDMNESPAAKWRKMIVNPCDSISEILNIRFQMFKEFFTATTMHTLE